IRLVTITPIRLQSRRTARTALIQPSIYGALRARQAPVTPRTKPSGLKIGKINNPGTPQPWRRRLLRVGIDCHLDAAVRTFALNLSVELRLRRSLRNRPRRNDELGRPAPPRVDV